MTRVKEIIKLSGRKSYMFLIGKINHTARMETGNNTVFDRYNHTARMEKGNNTMLTPSEQLGL